MNIGTLARLAEVSVDTIRYYEKLALIPPARRGDSGYRLYADEDVQRLCFIRRAKALGFTLEEIAGLLELSEQREDMGQVKAAALARIAAIEDKIAQLQRIRDALAGLVDACPGHGTLAQCPIMAALSEEVRHG